MKPSRPLYEREPELAAAAEAVDALCGGQAAGGLLVFTGEAGIGKTALLDEIRMLAADRCTVWSARGGETVTSVPFHVVRQLLQPALDQFPVDETRALFGDWFEITAPALGLAVPSGPQPDPQGVRDGLDFLVSRLASRLSHRPLLLIVDDAHWADGESLAWLAGFTARLSELPVLVVQAHRPQEFADRNAEWAQAREEESGGSGGGRTALTRVALRPLTPDATAELVRAALGEHADDPFCREVWAVTGGNPYEAVELVAKAQDGEMAPVEDSAGLLRELGASARGSGLITRLERLGTNANRFAWAAAVLGTDISQELAARLAGMSPAEAADCTARLREARIVSGFDPLEFVHPLIASAVYRSIPPATRTAMHGRAAWAISDAGLGPRPPPGTSSKSTRTTTRKWSPSSARRRASTSPSAPRKPPGAAWNAPWRNRPGRTTGRASSTNSAAPPCSAHPPPRCSTSAPHWTHRAWTSRCGSTPPSGWRPLCPTTTS